MRTAFLASLGLAGTLLLSGCGALKQELADTNASLLQTQESLSAAQQALSDAQAELQGANGQIERLNGELTTCNQRLNECSGAYQELQGLSSLRDAELQARLAELNQLREQSQRSQRLYESLIERLRGLIDAGQLSITNERGRLVINLPQDILFGSGSATLGREGIDALTEVGKVLATITDRRFQVEGHSDNVPISTSRFPSNWELSSARALSVVKILIDSGVRATALSGAGYGEFSPKVPNDTAEHRTQNRRIEIVLVPDLDILTSGN